MPTNAEIHAAIDLIVRSPHNHILTGAVADILDDIVDNITGGPGGVSGIDTVLAQAEALTDDRTIDLNGHEIEFVYGVNQPFYIDPTPGAEISSIRANNSTGGGNVAYTFNGTTNDQAQNEIQANFNAGSKVADILLIANTDGATITFASDSHVFIGDVNINNGNKISTDGGTTKWRLGGVTDGTPTPDKTIDVIINGTTYKIAAEED